jgi:hypothetical protein
MRRNQQHISFGCSLSHSAPPFHHLWLSKALERIYQPSCEQLYATSTSQRKQKKYLCEHFCIESFCSQNTQRNTVLRYYTPQSRSAFWLLKPASKPAHARLLLRPSWSWIVLLPSDTHRKDITHITDVLLPFVSYLLTLPRRITIETITNCIEHFISGALFR